MEEFEDPLNHDSQTLPAAVAGNRVLGHLWPAQVLLPSSAWLRPELHMAEKNAARLARLYCVKLPAGHMQLPALILPGEALCNETNSLPCCHGSRAPHHFSESWQLHMEAGSGKDGSIMQDFPHSGEASARSCVVCHEEPCTIDVVHSLLPCATWAGAT